MISLSRNVLRNRTSRVRLESILVLSVFVFCLTPALGDDGLSRYLIGNSLTWDTVPSKLDGDVQWHVDCGKPLPYIFEHPEKPCVKASTIWPKALKEKQYDLISVQPHYGSTLTEDVTVISSWLEMQPKAVFIIHSGWARSASQAEEYANEEASEQMEHSQAYIEALLFKLQALHPKREFRQSHAQDLLARVADDIKEGKAPFEKLEDVYRDKIHMNVVTGRYLMHNAMRHVMGQPRSAAGFEKLSPDLKAYFDGVLDTLGKSEG